MNMYPLASTMYHVYIQYWLFFGLFRFVLPSRPWSGPSMMKTMKMKCAPARRTQQAAVVVMTTMSNADEDTQGAAQHNTGQPRTWQKFVGFKLQKKIIIKFHQQWGSKNRFLRPPPTPQKAPPESIIIFHHEVTRKVGLHCIFFFFFKVLTLAT